jgi:hypothetical protein
LDDSVLIGIEFFNDFFIKKYHISTRTENEFKLKTFAEGERISVYNKSFRAGLDSIGWSLKEIRFIKSRLDDCNSSSIYAITGDGGIDIKFSRSLIGVDYGYLLFDQSFPKSFRSFIQGRCNFKIIDSTTVINSEAGVFGSDCLPDK